MGRQAPPCRIERFSGSGPERSSSRRISSDHKPISRPNRSGSFRSVGAGRTLLPPVPPSPLMERTGRVTPSCRAFQRWSWAALRSNTPPTCRNRRKMSSPSPQGFSGERLRQARAANEHLPARKGDALCLGTVEHHTKLRRHAVRPGHVFALKACDGRVGHKPPAIDLLQAQQGGQVGNAPGVNEHGTSG